MTPLSAPCQLVVGFWPMNHSNGLSPFYLQATNIWLYHHAFFWYLHMWCYYVPIYHKNSLRWVSEQTLGSFHLHFGKLRNYGFMLVFLWMCNCLCVPQVFTQILPSTASQIQNNTQWWETVDCIIPKNECDVTRWSITSHLHVYWNDCARYCQISKVQKTFTILARKRLYLVCSVLHRYQILQILEYKMDPDFCFLTWYYSLTQTGLDLG